MARKNIILNLEDGTLVSKRELNIPVKKNKKVIENAEDLYIRCLESPDDDQLKCQTILMLYEALEMYSQDEAENLYKRLDYDPENKSALVAIKKALGITEEEYSALLSRYNTLRSQIIQLEKTIIRDRLGVVQNKIKKTDDTDKVKTLQSKQAMLIKEWEIIDKQEEGGTAKIPTDKLSAFFHNNILKNKNVLKTMLLEIQKRCAMNIAEKLDNTMESDESSIRILNKDYDRKKELGISITLPSDDGEGKDVTNDVIIQGMEAFFLSESNIYITSSVVTDYIDKIITDAKYVL